MYNWLFSLLFILFSGFCSAQKPIVQLIVEPKVAQVGEEITVKVISNIANDIEIDLPAAFIQNGAVMSGSETEFDGFSGKTSKSFYKANAGVFNKDGVYTFGPAIIRKNNKVFKSNTVSVKIEKDLQVSTPSNYEFTTKQLSKPAFGIIEKSKSKIYEGEPIVLTAKVYARYKPTHFEGYEPFELQGQNEKHDINSGKDPEIKNIKGIEYYCFEANRQLLFPTAIGKFQITPFKMDLKKGFDGYAFSSGSSSIEVIPLPENAPKDFNGGIGKFSLEKKISHKSYNQGDFIEMTLIVSGEGNIHALQPPIFELPKEFSLYGDPIIEEDFSFGSNGSSGKLIYKYNIQLFSAGEIYLPPISISYFDVNKKKYITLRKEKEKFIVIANKKTINAFNQSKPNQNVYSKSIEKHDKLKTTKLKSNFSLYILIFIISFFSLIIFYFIYKKIGREEIREISKDLNTSNTNFELKLNQELNKAQEAMINSDSDMFYSAINRSIYIICSFLFQTDSLIIQNKNELFEKINSYDVSEKLIHDINFVLSQCEEARYGLGDDKLNQAAIFELTNKIILELKQVKF